MYKPLISVSQNAVSQAERAIEGCEFCCSDAEVAFCLVLNSFRNYDIDQVEYILPVLGSCPQCAATLDEHTLVKRRAILPKR